MSTAKKTREHDKIQKWVEDHDGVPTVIEGTKNQSGAGILRIHFPGHSKDDDQFDEISWDEFFKEFDQQKLDFLYTDEKDSTFHKFVNRD